MSFTDQKPRIATEKDINAPWGGRKNRFRCYLCGHKFKIGDIWRWVFANFGKYNCCNFLVCEKCDGEDVIDRFQKIKDKYSWIWRE